MSLVFRKDQSTPLTNDQLDGNFEYLRDQVLLKYDIAAFTAPNISAALADASASDNALDSWTLRGLEPSSALPITTNKSSIVSRDALGNITALNVYANLVGNADTATLATTAISANSLGSYIVPLTKGGTGANNANDARVNLEALHTGGTNSMTAKLVLSPATSINASLNFGSSLVTPDVATLQNGDMWIDNAKVKIFTSGITKTLAEIDSPTFVGIPLAPSPTGDSQIATLSHLNAAVTNLNSAINTKANSESPTLTGIPLAPGVSGASQIATLSHITQSVNTASNALTNSYQIYTDTKIVVLRNELNNSISTKAAIASPVFTGNPLVPTQATGDRSTKIANTEFVSNTAGVIIAQLQASVSALQDAINSTRPVPAASVFYLATTAVPYGYLEANGQAVSISTYNALWNALGQPNNGNGTFNIPDLRGEFIRSWDNGRGVDPGRVFRSVQGSQNLEHNHGYSDTYYREAWGNGQNYGIGSRSTDYDNSDYNYSKATNTSGGSEARPRNIALMPIIKW
jgi:phage-related tail fiber protein